jgi:thiol-disulfide isomerase/thioredoxin
MLKMQVVVVAVWLLLCCGVGALQEVTNDTFDALVGIDDRAWVIEFGSKFCESCKQFAPVFSSIAEKHASSVNFAVCYVDAPPGAALATRFGAFDVGLPVVYVFDNTNTERHTVLEIENVSSKQELVGKLKSTLGRLQKRDGKYIKAASNTEF